MRAAPGGRGQGDGLPGRRLRAARQPGEEDDVHAGAVTQAIVALTLALRTCLNTQRDASDLSRPVSETSSRLAPAGTRVVTRVSVDPGFKGQVWQRPSPAGSPFAVTSAPGRLAPRARA